MTELYRSDSDVVGLLGTTPSAGLPLPELDVLDWYIPWAILWSRLCDAMVVPTGLEVYKDGDLTCGVRPGRFLDGDTARNYAGDTAEALTNNTTNYIYLTAGATLTINATGFPVPSVTPHIPIATIATGSASVAAVSGKYNHVDIVDYRGRSMFSIAGAAAGNLLGLDWQESVADELDFTSAEPAAPSLGDRYLNTGSGASSETAQTVAANDIEEWNGTDWTEITPDEGAVCLVEDRDMLIGFNGAAWVDIGTLALLAEAQAFFAATDISGAQAETLTDGSNADSLHVHDTPGLTDRAVTDIKRELTTIEANTAGVGSPNILIADESRKVLTNEGAGALNYHTLPGAAAGLVFTFIVDDANGMRIVAAGGDTIRIGATVSIAAGYIESTAVGDTITLVAVNAAEWYAVPAAGTWTVETS